MAAFANAQAVRRKIRAVQNIKKITRAMQMVSAAKLRKVQDRLMSIRPYADKIRELLQRLSGQVRETEHPFFTPRESVRRVAYVVMMSDKGLCGSYNSNMMRYAGRFMDEKGLPHAATAIGRKTVQFLRKRGTEVLEQHIQLPTEVPFTQIQRMTGTLVDLYLKGEVDEVYMLFTRYVNARGGVLLRAGAGRDPGAAAAPLHRGLVPPAAAGVLLQRARRAHERDAERDKQRAGDDRVAYADVQQGPPVGHHQGAARHRRRRGSPERIRRQSWQRTRERSPRSSARWWTCASTRSCRPSIRR
ncbi:MAG: F0F1 ATP synthase subunit gamma [Planctomycetota bacterium]|jgi:hypothetical protein